MFILLHQFNVTFSSI